MEIEIKKKEFHIETKVLVGVVGGKGRLDNHKWSGFTEYQPWIPKKGLTLWKVSSGAMQAEHSKSQNNFPPSSPNPHTHTSLTNGPWLRAGG